MRMTKKITSAKTIQVILTPKKYNPVFKRAKITSADNMVSKAIRI